MVKESKVKLAVVTRAKPPCEKCGLASPLKDEARCDAVNCPVRARVAIVNLGIPALATQCEKT